MRVLYTIFFLLMCSKYSYGKLQSVNDEELVHLFKTEKYVIVLFSKPNCETCDNIENELIGLRDELVDSLGAWVIKAVNSQLSKLYSPSKEPALVYFRNGTPLLYDGPINEENILQIIMDNKEPTVKEITDDTFEHLTQASTGATTGDWLIMFYSASCIDCQRLQAVWESVGAILKNRVNVARVNKGGAGSVTARRFDIQSEPTFILFRQGKMYHYELPKLDVKSFVSFARDWYKNTRSEKVPVPKSPFDDLVALCVDLIRQAVAITTDILVRHPWIWQISVGGFGLVAITSIIAIYKAGRSSSSKTAPSKKLK